MPIPGPYLPDEEDEDELWSAMADPRLYAQANPQRVRGDALREVSDVSAALSPAPIDGEPTFADPTVEGDVNKMWGAFNDPNDPHNLAMANPEPPTMPPQGPPIEPGENPHTTYQQAFLPGAQPARDPRVVEQANQVAQDAVAEVLPPAAAPVAPPEGPQPDPRDEADTHMDALATEDEPAAEPAAESTPKAAAEQAEASPDTQEAEPDPDEYNKIIRQQLQAALRPTPETPDEDEGDRAGYEGPLEADVAKDEPGMFEGNEELMWAALADLVLNKGRGVGALIGANTQFKNQWSQRRIDNKLKAAQIENAHRRSGGDDTFQRQSLALRKQEGIARLLALGQGETAEARRLGDQKIRKDELDLRKQVHDLMYNPNNPLATEFKRASEINFGMPVGWADNLNQAQMNTYGPGIMKFGELWLKDKMNIKEAEGAALKKKKEIEAANELKDVSAQTEGTIAAGRETGTRTAAAPYEDAKRRREYSEKFRTAHKRDLDMVGLIEGIESAPEGAVPTTVLERFARKVPFLGVALTPERQTVMARKEFVVNSFQRGESGAAIPPSERAELSRIMGATWDSPEARIEAAWNELSRIVQKRIYAAGAGGNDDVVRDVLKRYSDDVSRWLPDEPAGAAPGAPPAAPAGPAGPTTQLQAPRRQPGDPTQDELDRDQDYYDGSIAVDRARDEGKPPPVFGDPGYEQGKQSRNFWIGVRDTIAETWQSPPPAAATPSAAAPTPTPARQRAKKTPQAASGNDELNKIPGVTIKPRAP